MNFPFYHQPVAKDYGPTCLWIISKFYGKIFSFKQIRDFYVNTREDSSLLGLSDAAKQMGFRSMDVQIDFKTMLEKVPLPYIVYWNKVHFVVVYGIKQTNSLSGKEGFRVRNSDPSYGLLEYSKKEFIKSWIGDKSDNTTEEGIVLLLETTPSFSRKLSPLSLGEGLGVRIKSQDILKTKSVFNFYFAIYSSKNLLCFRLPLG